MDDESRNIYFELQLSSEGSEPLSCVEVAASKIHVNGILISTMYFGGTLYATISSGSEGEHALLDSSFPDVTTKGRGYTIGATPHSYYKKFSVWEGNNEGNLVGSASSPKSSNSGPALSDSSNSPTAGSKSNTNEKGSSRGTESKDADSTEREASFGGKTNEGSGGGGGGGGGRGGGIGPVKTSGRRLAPLRKEIGPGGFGAKPPSRLAPLGESFGNRPGKLSGLQPLKKIGLNAPWDAMGRPKLGALGGGGGSSNKK